MMKVAPKNITDKYEEVIPGVYFPVPIEEYHAEDGVGKTNICDIHEAIKIYNLRKATPIKRTTALLKGSMIHDLAFLPDIYKQTYLVGPTIGDKTKAHKQCVEDNPDRIVVTPGMSDDVYAMRDALYDNPTIKEILDSDTVLREVSMWVNDPFTGILLKIRPDIIHDGIIFDLKSTITPHAKGFRHSVFTYNYHVQSALYQDVARINGLKITNFKFLVVGSKPPYLTAIYDLTEEDVQEGRDKYREGLTQYHAYLSGKDRWDGLSHGRETVTL